MPDLTTEFFYECASVQHFICTAGKYTVSVDRFVEGGWRCTCSAFKYKKFVEGTPYCKHIIEVQKENYCGWMQFISGGEPVLVEGERTCPECGGGVISQGWAV